MFYKVFVFERDKFRMNCVNLNSFCKWPKMEASYYLSKQLTYVYVKGYNTKVIIYKCLVPTLLIIQDGCLHKYQSTIVKAYKGFKFKEGKNEFVALILHDVYLLITTIVRYDKCLPERNFNIKMRNKDETQDLL